MGTKVLIILGVLLVFIAVNIAVIILFHKKQETLEEYSVGSRSFGWILVSFAFMGGFYGGSIYTDWFSESARIGVFAQYTLIYYAGSHLILLFMIRPVWTWGKVYGLQTQGDLIELRYKSRLFKLLFSSIVFVFWIPWLILEMKQTGYILFVVTDGYINSNIGTIFICIFVIIYIFYGGLRASATSSVVQGLTFILLGTAVFYYLIHQAYGGILPLFRQVEDYDPSLLILQKENGGNVWTSFVVMRILSAFCWPGIFCNLYMAKNPKALKRIVLISPLAGVLITMSVLLLGLGGSMIEGFPLHSQYGIFFMADKFGGTSVLALTCLVALSGCMATLSGILGTAAVIIAKDFGGFIKGNDNTLINARVCSIIIGLISLWVATIDLPNLVVIANIMYNCIGQAIVPLLLGQYWRKSNLHGAASGMLAGIGFTLYATMFPEAIAWANGFTAGIIGLGINLTIHITLGFVFGKQAHVDEIFETLKK